MGGKLVGAGGCHDVVRWPCRAAGLTAWPETGWQPQPDPGKVLALKKLKGTHGNQAAPLCVITGDETKIHILRQEKCKHFSLPVWASSLPSSVLCASALCINQTSPTAEIPAQP